MERESGDRHIFISPSRSCATSKINMRIRPRSDESRALEDFEGELDLDWIVFGEQDAQRRAVRRRFRGGGSRGCGRSAST